MTCNRLLAAACYPRLRRTPRLDRPLRQVLPHGEGEPSVRQDFKNEFLPGQEALQRGGTDLPEALKSFAPPFTRWRGRETLKPVSLHRASDRPVFGECASKREKLGDASQRSQIPREMPSNHRRPDTHGDKSAKPRPPATPSFALHRYRTVVWRRASPQRVPVQSL